LDQLTKVQSDLIEQLNYSSLDTYTSQIDVLDLTAFGLPNVDELLLGYNQNISSGPYYNRNNISSATENDYARDTIVALIQCETQANSLIASIRNSTDSIVAVADQLRADVIQFNNDLTDLLNGVIMPLFNQTDTLVNSFNCLFLGEAYVDMKTAMCHTLLDGMTYVALYAFLVIIFAIPTTFVWCVLATIIRNQNLKEHIGKFERNAVGEIDVVQLPRIRVVGGVTSTGTTPMDNTEDRRASAPNYDTRSRSSSGER